MRRTKITATRSNLDPFVRRSLLNSLYTPSPAKYIKSASIAVRHEVDNKKNHVMASVMKIISFFFE